MLSFQTIFVLKILLLTLCFKLTKPTLENGRNLSESGRNIRNKRNVLEPILPKAEPLLGAGQPEANLPVFPERPDAVYFIVAVKGGAKTWSRTLARTLLDMGPPFGSPQGPPLRPIYVDLPQNGKFSAKVLTTLCDQIEGEPIAGMVVIGDGHGARAVAMAGGAMKIPVLWAKGGTANIHGLGRETETQLQSMLQPSAREILEAIRALFLQTHWHTFFVISDVGATILLGSSEGNPLKEPPLVPTILPLQSKNDDVFRQLAQVSRSTRGVVLLLCDLGSARRVMSEAKRLNMAGGHFIWLWADTSSTTEFFDAVHIPEMENTDEKFSDIDTDDAITKLRQEFNLDDNYDHIDEHTSKHISEILERRMEFEDFDPHYRRNNKTKPNSDLSRFHHIIGLIDSKRSDEINLKSDKFISDSVKLKTKRSSLTTELDDPSLSKLNSTNRSKSLLFPSSSVENSKKKSFETEAPEATPNTNKKNMYINKKSLNSDELTSSKANQKNFQNFHNFNDNQYKNTNNNNNNFGKVLFDSSDLNGAKSKEKQTNLFNNQNARNRPNMAGGDTSSASSSYEDSEEGDLKSTNTSEFSKSKRANYHKSPLNLTTSTSHVLFHHFKDFPVGFLALRPVKMNVDRHFIRSAIRLFATTWSKVEKEEEEHFLSNNNAYNTNINKNRKMKDKININWNEWSGDDGGSGGQRQQQSRRKMSNSKENEEIYNETNANKNRKKERRTKRRTASSSFSLNANEDDDNVADSVTIPNNETNSQHTVNSKKTNIVNKPVNNINISSSTDNNLTSVQNQIMSGLNLTKISNKTNYYETVQQYESNNSNLNKQVIAVNKRQHTWWSSSANNDPQQQQAYGSGLSGGSYRLHKDMRTQRNRQYGAPQYRGGCYGSANRGEVRKAEQFAKNLQDSAKLALSGQKLPDNIVEKALVTHFELLNLVPTFIKPIKQNRNYFHENKFDGSVTDSSATGATKWRRVGLVSGKNVHLDTIVWPGGDIVVSGLSARSRTIFRIVTALSPPFVMESDLDEDGQCLRGLLCHRLSTSGKHNLTLMFNAIETRDRLEEDAIEHHGQAPPEEEEEKIPYRSKCCYGLSMDLLENIAEELGFEFHLYIVRDELFGAKFNNLKDWTIKNKNKQAKQQEQFDNDQHNKSKEQHKKSYESIKTQFEPNFGANFDRSHHQQNKKLNHQVADAETIEENNYSMNYEHEEQRSEMWKLKNRWNGIMGDLIAGSADMSFAPLTVSKSRANVIDFSVPYFHSGVSLLAAPQTKSEIPLLAFLLPFSPELWIAIFTSLNITAVAVAVYEWLSPFGLNPWGRQRSKNFSMSSALWVMWGLLCGHLVAFKAPKSWPNKFLINIWGGFSVIFIASYTANIAALIAGLFFQNSGNKYEAPLLTQRVGIATSTAAEYVQKNDKHLWEHMKKYSLKNIEDGIEGLKNGSIDLLMGDSPILDYYRGTAHGCSLQRIGDTYVEDVYAIGMTKGFPLKDSISALIAKYSSNGYLDILTAKWYGGLPCYKNDMGVEIVQPRPLGVAAVAGVFCLLGLGMVLGILILIFEHLFYKYTLPILRHKPKGTVWRSRNIMFFSQKLYRFINCVELVSPHHAARELVHTLRQGQITSLFQKSVKRKEDEQRRRRKSKAQFFEMIQEIRRVQQQEREQAPVLEAVAEEHTTIEIQTIEPQKITVKNAKSSPRGRLLGIPIKKESSKNSSKSSGLNVRRFSTDSILGERLDTIGRRLSRDITNSPPDLGHRFETFGKNSTSNKFDTFSGSKSQENVTATDMDQYKEVTSVNKFDTFSGKVVDEEKPELPIKMNKKYQNRRPPLNMDVWKNDKPPLPPLKEKLYPPIIILDQSKHALRDKLHEELRTKYGPNRTRTKRTDGLYPKGIGELSSRRASDVNGRTHKYQRNRSTESIDRELGRPTPSPRRSKRDLDIPLSLPPKISPRNTSTSSSSNSNSRAIPLGRLSKEDLLMLSQSTESEIHEFLQNPLNGNSPSDPP